MQKERVAMLGSSQVWLMPVTGFCSPLKWTWLKYLPGCAVLGCCTHLCDRSSGCLMGEVIRHLCSASTCWRNLERVFSQVVTGTSFASLEISDLFSCCAFFFLPQMVNVHHYFCLLFRVDPLSIMTRGSILQLLSLSSTVPCCWEQNSFFKRQMAATLFSLNKKAKQLLRCKQSRGQQIVSASSVGEVSLQGRGAI